MPRVICPYHSNLTITINNWNNELRWQKYNENKNHPREGSLITKLFTMWRDVWLNYLGCSNWSQVPELPRGNGDKIHSLDSKKKFFTKGDAGGWVSKTRTSVAQEATLLKQISPHIETQTTTWAPFAVSTAKDFQPVLTRAQLPRHGIGHCHKLRTKDDRL